MEMVDQMFFISMKDPNLNIIIDSLISETEHVIVQKFIKNVKKVIKEFY